MKIQITLEWFQDVPENRKNDLTEAGMDRAHDMMKEGYVGGELHCEWEDSGGEMESYSGWWAVKELEE